MFSNVVINVPDISGLLWIVYLVFILVWAIVSLVLMHHWKYYGIGEDKKIFAKSLYFTVSVILLAVVLAVLLGYQIT